MNYFQKHYGTGWGPIGGAIASVGLSAAIWIMTNWIAGLTVSIIVLAVWFFNRNTK